MALAQSEMSGRLSSYAMCLCVLATLFFGGYLGATINASALHAADALPEHVHDIPDDLALLSSQGNLSEPVADAPALEWCAVSPSQRCSGHQPLQFMEVARPAEPEYLSAANRCPNGAVVARFTEPVRLGVDEVMSQMLDEQLYVDSSVPAPGAAGIIPVCALAKMEPHPQGFHFNSLPALAGCRAANIEVLVVPWHQHKDIPWLPWHMELLAMAWPGRIIRLLPGETLVAAAGSVVPCVPDLNERPPQLSWRTSPRCCVPNANPELFSNVWTETDLLRNRLCHEAATKAAIGYQVGGGGHAALVFARRRDEAIMPGQMLGSAQVETGLREAGWEIWDSSGDDKESSLVDRMLGLRGTKLLLIEQGPDMLQAMYMPFNGCVLHVANQRNKPLVKFSRNLAKGLGGCWIGLYGVTDYEYGQSEQVVVPPGNQAVLSIDGVNSKVSAGTFLWSQISKLNGKKFGVDALRRLPVRPGGYSLSRRPYVLSSSLGSYRYKLKKLKSKLANLSRMSFQELKALSQAGASEEGCDREVLDN